MGFVRQNHEELDGFSSTEGEVLDTMKCPGCGKHLANLGDVVGTDDPRCADCGTPIYGEKKSRKRGKKHRHHRRGSCEFKRIERAAMGELLEAAAAEGGEWN